ncbi:serine acetyltransferase [Gaetbulibacter aestuarii]|uniref:Serine acetyltransferase n=1 Tax=Gaetbulibacter aestuarii TaxID=1502358 RepID=A0ABW7MUS6_9FLAO
MKKFYLFILKGFQHETNSFLPFNNKIKGPLNLMHGTYGIFISGKAVIGRNCSIYQQVTIGSNMLVDSKTLGSPNIGDNVVIGAGAKIIGNIKVGNNVRIGANAVVFFDVPDESVVVLGSPMVKSKKGLINQVYQYKNNKWGYLKDGSFYLEKDKAVLNRLKNI